MQQGKSSMMATGGRAASRERRAQLVQGKAGLPPASERVRTGAREARIADTLPAAPAEFVPAPAEAPVAGAPAPAVWSRQRITGTRFSSDETNQPGTGAGGRVTGDTPRPSRRVTGTERGAERDVTGTPYFVAAADAETRTSGIERAADAFSVRSPQFDAQLRGGGAAGRITGTFARGEGKITGNQEFLFAPRAAADKAARTRVTGEGRIDGPKMTGGAWEEKSNVTGTEDYIAAERNPSERAGARQNFAGAGAFKGKGRHDAPRQTVTGMVGWSAKSAAKVTISGGGQG